MQDEKACSAGGRAVAACGRCGKGVALVIHADLAKTAIDHYIGISLVHVPLINMDNASASPLTFHPDPK